MKLEYEVPEHLEPYLEYIPEDKLSEMITMSLEKAIANRSMDDEDSAVSEQPDYTELINKLTEVFNNKAIIVNAEPQTQEVAWEEPTYTFKAVTVNDCNGSEDEEEVDDFLADICR